MFKQAGIICLIIQLFISCYLFADTFPNGHKADIYSVMKRVAEWQIADFPNNCTRPEHENWMWTNAVLYIGMEHLAQLDTSGFYYHWLDSIAQTEYYQPGPRMYHADDLAIIQLYLALYEKYSRPEILYPSQARLEFIINHPSTNHDLWITGRKNPFDRWVWCDALFMAPPVFAHMGRLTNDVAYFHFLEKEYWATVDYLYDPEECLFFRDHRYFDLREENGRKIFWGRGNGWVLAGLALILSELPNDYPTRQKYIKLYTDMTKRIISLQDKNGMWHPSLLDMVSYPTPETSATALIGYAIAWGINNEILPKSYTNQIQKTWESIVSCVQPDGKLGFVQPIGADPKHITKNQTEVYGVGAFLLFGSEIYKMQ